MSNVESKSAVVTGATRGIGLAVARAILERGGCVFLCARDNADVERTVVSLKSEHGNRVWGGACDVRSYDDVRSFFPTVRLAF